MYLLVAATSRGLPIPMRIAFKWYKAHHQNIDTGFLLKSPWGDFKRKFRRCQVMRLNAHCRETMRLNVVNILLIS
jgi:hypothetical protein